MTTSTVLAGRKATAAAPMPIRRVWNAYWSEIKYECLRMMRTPAFAIPFLAIPIALYLFFGLLISGNAEASRNANTPIYLYTGFTVVGIMGPGLFGFGMSIALERDQGLLRLKRALPMPPAAYVIAKMCMAMLFSAVVALAIALLAVYAKGLPLGARAVGVFAVQVLGTLPFCAIGLFIGARVNGRIAPAIVNVVYLPMIYLSGLFFPLPESIRWIAVFSPAFHLNQLALGIAGVPSVFGVAGPTIHTAALLGVTVVFAGLTLHRLSRD
jgi:ABC-2 type transport system permease protein